MKNYKASPTEKRIRQAEPIPLYYQVLSSIRSDIVNGLISPGEMLPPEAELCEQYKVSRGTLRKAIQILADEKLIYKKQGIGTFVTSGKINLDLMNLRGLLEELRDQGHDPEISIVERSVIIPPLSISNSLQLNEGEPVISLCRVVSSKDEKLAVTKTYYPYKTCSALMEGDPRRNIYEFLEDELNLTISHAVQDITPYLPTADEVAILDVEPNSLLYNIDWITYLINGKPIFMGNSKLRADRYSFRVILHRSLKKST